MAPPLRLTFLGSFQATVAGRWPASYPARRKHGVSWVRVFASQGLTGWVAADYLTLVNAQP